MGFLYTVIIFAKTYLWNCSQTCFSKHCLWLQHTELTVQPRLIQTLLIITREPSNWFWLLINFRIFHKIWHALKGKKMGLIIKLCESLTTSSVLGCYIHFCPLQYLLQLILFWEQRSASRVDAHSLEETTRNLSVRDSLIIWKKMKRCKGRLL